MKTLTSSKYVLLITLGLVAFILRFYRLGSIPWGISAEAATFGLSMANYFGNQILNPLFVRLPFAILGGFSIFLLYFLVRRLTGNFKLSYLTSLLLAITPWHIHESRIFSSGILVTFILLFVALIFSNQLKSHGKLLISFFLTLSLLLVILSIVKTFPKVGERVDIERQLAGKVTTPTVSKIFSNKLVVSYRKNISLLYEHLDFGVYFFGGHP